ncbi:MAG: SDR family oxidoreductase [Spongiibacteraceae bacterium]
MKLGIEGKVALVVGGTQGLGLACAEEFGAEGCKVVVASRTQANVDKAVAKLREAGYEVSGFAADCTSKAGIEGAVAFTQRTYGSPDIALYNVDSGTKGAFLDIDDEILMQACNNNVMGFVWMSRAIIPHMQEQRWGRILTIGTNSVKQPHRELPRAAQNTFRVGALALCKTMSAELGKWGITVNTMGTGGFETDQFKEVFGKIAASNGRSYQDQMALMSKNVPMGRIGDPKEMAAAVAFLASDRAGYITGQVLVIDGGLIESLQ